MAHYTGPKARVNRAYGTLIYEESGAVKALERHNSPPGMNRARRRATTTFALGLAEKQKLKHYYGLGDRQLRRLLDIASRQPGNTGVLLLLLCERRLDNIVRRAGFTHTRPQARQGIVHGHFLVNGRRLDRPGYLALAGDVVEVRPRDNLKALYGTEVDRSTGLSWLDVDLPQLRATVLSLPTEADVSLPVEISRVVEFYR